MSAHTPGPWHMRTNRHPTTSGLPWGWVDAAPPGGEQRPLSGVRVEWTRGEQSEANARLIAAAPEMLEALQGMLVEKPIDEILVYAKAAKEKARAVIAKATGEAA